MQSSTLRFVLAVILMIAVIIVTNLLFPPIPPEPALEATAVDSVGAVVAEDTAPAPAESADTGDAAAADSARRPDTLTAPTVAPATAAGTRLGADARAPSAGDAEPALPADTLWVASELYRYGLSPHGGGVVSAQLTEFKSFTRDGSVELVPDTLRHPLVRYRLQSGNDTLDLSTLPFEVVAADDGAAGQRVVLRHTGAAAVELEYLFDPDRYLAHVSLRTPGIDNATLLIDVGPRLRTNEVRPEEDQQALAYVVNTQQDGIRSVRLEEVEGRRVDEGPLEWAAVKNKYFLLALLAGHDADGPKFGGLIAHDVPGDGARLTVTLQPTAESYDFRLYMGPQEFGRLNAIGQDLEDANPIGWRIFRPIVQPLAHMVLWALEGLHDVLGLGYGWVLILFGVMMRVVLWPVNAKAMRSQLKTMEVQPLIKEIQAKHKGNPERLQKEMLRLYKEEGFNPLGGCWPMLLPWPILITLFFVFQNTISFRGVEFLWLPDLSQPDPLYILPIVMGASIFLLQWLNLRAVPQDNPQMKMMTYFMPIIMVVIFFQFASGLNLYYAASNVASLPQQLQIIGQRKRVRAKIQKKDNGG